MYCGALAKKFQPGSFSLKVLICHELVKVQFYHDQEIPTQLGPSKLLRSGEFCKSWQQSGVYNSRMLAHGSNL